MIEVTLGELERSRQIMAGLGNYNGPIRLAWRFKTAFDEAARELGRMEALRRTILDAHGEIVAPGSAREKELLESGELPATPPLKPGETRYYLPPDERLAAEAEARQLMEEKVHLNCNAVMVHELERAEETPGARRLTVLELSALAWLITEG